MPNTRQLLSSLLKPVGVNRLAACMGVADVCMTHTPAPTTSNAVACCMFMPAHTHMPMQQLNDSPVSATRVPQDNQLQSFPDISCHPQLTCLLLDSNRLGSIAPTPSHSNGASDGSNGGAGVLLQQQLLQHTCLQVLSLTSNHLTSLCGSCSAAPVQATPSHCSATGVETKASNGGSSNGGSTRDSSCSRPGSRVGLHHSISSWLPALQVLRLSGNQLQDLCGLEGCLNLRVLDVSRNQLTCLQVMPGGLAGQVAASGDRQNGLRSAGGFTRRSPALCGFVVPLAALSHASLPLCT